VNKEKLQCGSMFKLVMCHLPVELMTITGINHHLPSDLQRGDMSVWCPAVKGFQTRKGPARHVQAMAIYRQRSNKETGMQYILYSGLSYYNLWGLCILHTLLLHRSGIVFVPSIMSDPHMVQIFPVGFAFIAFLHVG
jgi:hypothetical protein